MHARLRAAGALLLLTTGAAAQSTPGLSRPERVFDELWTTFDRLYAPFAVRDTPWGALYGLYRPRVSARTTDEELFVVLADLLGHLDDNHALLETPDGHPDTYLVTGSLSERVDGVPRNRPNDGFSAEMLDEVYLREPPTVLLGGELVHGRLEGSIAYLRLTGFPEREPLAEALDAFLASAGDARGVVVDLRANGGGSTYGALELAGRFADERRLFALRRMRKGVAHDALTRPVPMQVEPTGAVRFAGPVVVLTGPFSQSAADVFALAARALPRVTLVGEPTSGAFSTILGLRLPNGWLYSVSYELVTDQAGHSWEGLGVPPHVHVANDPAEVEDGRDRQLELARELLSNGLGPREPPAGTLAVRDSLADVLGAWIAAHGLDAALAQRDDDPRDLTLAPEELWGLACDLHAAGDEPAVLAVLEILFTELAGEWFFAEPGRDWDVLLDGGSAAVRARILAEAARLDPAFPLTSRLVQRAAESRADEDD